MLKSVSKDLDLLVYTTSGSVRVPGFISLFFSMLKEKEPPVNRLPFLIELSSYPKVKGKVINENVNKLIIFFIFIKCKWL